MTGLLTEDDPGKLRPANAVMIPSPMPTQVVASDEVWPSPRTESKHLARHPWRMDDERLLHPFRERGARAGEGRGNLARGHVIGEPLGATIVS